MASVIDDTFITEAKLILNQRVGDYFPPNEVARLKNTYLDVFRSFPEPETPEAEEWLLDQDVSRKTLLEEEIPAIQDTNPNGAAFLFYTEAMIGISVHIAYYVEPLYGYSENEHYDFLYYIRDNF